MWHVLGKTQKDTGKCLGEIDGKTVLEDLGINVSILK
jgi:hypothetical protein